MKSSPKPRGRPKTLNRAQVLECAMMQYWRKGPAEVSINDICKLTNHSKPGIYREFGSDDGLKMAALKSYKALAIDPFLEIFTSKQGLKTTLEEAVCFLMQDREGLDLPKGCLFVAMRAQRDRLGQRTLETLEHVRQNFLQALSEWVDAIKRSGEFQSATASRIIAHHIDGLHAQAMRMQRENAPAAEIEQTLKYGFATIFGRNG